MVGYNPGAQVAGPSPKESVLAGSAAGMVTRALVSPLDVLKIRFQVNVRPYILDVASDSAASELRLFPTAPD